MNIITELLKKEGYENHQIESITKAFVKETVVKNPEMLADITETVVKKQMQDIKEINQKRFNLSLNFLPIKELISTGKINSAKMQSFSGLLDNNLMEENYNKEILEHINNIEIKNKN